jgi:hypothetical protein
MVCGEGEDGRLVVERRNPRLSYAEGGKEDFQDVLALGSKARNFSFKILLMVAFLIDIIIRQ